MLVVVSPAKKLDMSPVDVPECTLPTFQHRAIELAGVAGNLSAAELSKLMHISDSLAKLNEDRFANFGSQEKKAALYMFAGDTYTGLDAATLTPDAVRWAQSHLRILSGLYGLLRPLDEMEPYRLEMGSKLKTARGKSLYEYWGDTLSHALNTQARETGAQVLVNCASKEYFTAVDQTALDLKVVTPKFLEDTDKGPKIISFYAKQARGSMARFVIENRLTDPTGLQDFSTGGYVYQPDQSTPEEPVFLRPSA